MSDEDSTHRPADGRDRTTWLAGGMAAAAIAAIATLSITRTVSEQHVSDAGQVVHTQRAFQLTDPLIVALGLVVLVGVSAFFTEISGFGITLKRQVREALTKADLAEGVSRSAEQRVELVEAGQRHRTADATLGPETMAAAAQLLARDYDAIRESMRSGSTRTTKMTAVMSRLVTQLTGAPTSPYRLDQSLSGRPGGERLSVYAYAYANPDQLSSPEFTALLDSIERDDKPFTQYWGLRALRMCTDATPSRLGRAERERFENLLGRVGSSTDRAAEIRAILSSR